MDEASILYEVYSDVLGSCARFSRDVKVGTRDFFEAFKKWRLLLYLANAEMRRTYHRTVIGPFWATLSLGIFILSMGVLFSLLWHTRINTYLPYFSSGYLVWVFLSTVIIGSCTTFTAMESYIKQIDLPYSFYAFSLVCRNVIIFFHQLVIFVLVAIIFHIPVTFNMVMAIPGFVLLVLNCSWMGIFLGVLCARYRDIQQIVASLLQVSMFVTPIFWSPDQLHGVAKFVCIQLNPLYHLLAVVRYPMMGAPAEVASWIVSLVILAVGWLLAMKLLGNKYHKLVYWL